MKGSSLGLTRKMTPLTVGALGRITRNTFVGGLGMLQVRAGTPHGTLGFTQY